MAIGFITSRISDMVKRGKKAIKMMNGSWNLIMKDRRYL